MGQYVNNKGRLPRIPTGILSTEYPCTMHALHSRFSMAPPAVHAFSLKKVKTDLPSCRYVFVPGSPYQRARTFSTINVGQALGI